MAQVVEVTPNLKEQTLKKVIALVEAGELDAAHEHIDKALRQEPNNAQWLVIAAEVMKKAKKLPIAYQLARRSTEVAPERPEPWAAFGHAAQMLWRRDEALSCYRKALQRYKTPEQKCLYLNNIASVHLDFGEFKAAEKFCREALEVDPESVSPRHNLGLSLLAQRRWAEGWPYYSASVGTGYRVNVKYRQPEEPTWDGTPGQRVVIYGEQGLGDEICAASIIPDVCRDATVTMDCDKRLVSLFRRSFPQAKVHGTRWDKQLNWPKEDREIDASIAAFEVAKFYRKSDADFPGTPYLTPCPDRTAMWKALFASKGKPTIGIAWSGGIWQNAALFRKLPLAEWKPIFDAVDAHWVSLQYKDAEADIAGTPVVQYRYATLTPDYDDTAALVAACDLVIGVQTTVCHLAGALGVPVWTLIPKTSQWRYGESGDSIPWYRSMKLYRQSERWPVKQVANDLAAYF